LEVNVTRRTLVCTSMGQGGMTLILTAGLSRILLYLPPLTQVHTIALHMPTITPFVFQTQAGIGQKINLMMPWGKTGAISISEEKRYLRTEKTFSISFSRRIPSHLTV
jgi:hypothetical protein